MYALPLTPLPTDGPRGFIGSIVVDGDRVFAVGGTHGQAALLCSEDRGRTFTTWPRPTFAPGLRDLHVEGDAVWVVGEWGCIAHTTNRGESWTQIRAAGSACLYSIMRGPDRRLWILGDDGLLLRSRSARIDAAPRFSKLKNRSKARLLYMFVDDDRTWIADSAGALQRSIPRGFVDVPLKAMRSPRPLCALVRTPRKTLVLLGDGGLILRSVNDGTSWKKIPIDSRNNLEKLLVTRYGIFVVGAAGSLLVSHDDGVSFQGIDTGVSVHLWSIAEIDGALIVGGEGGSLWRVERDALADLMARGYATRDPVLAGLAARLRDGDAGAELVLEDALKERELL